MTSSNHTIFLCLAFIALYALFTYWHIRENKRLIRLWQNNPAAQARQFISILLQRTWLTLGILAFGMLIIVGYDLQLGNTRVALNLRTQEIEEIKPPYYPPVSAKTDIPPPSIEAAAPTPPASHTAVSATTSETGDAVVIIDKNDTLGAQSANSPVQTIDAIYNPEKYSQDNQSVIDDIKKRYEDILVNYMFLEKCGKATPADYRVIMSALGQEMASANAPGRLQYDILTSARGSYKEMYTKSACGGDGFNSLYVQYTDYIKKLSDNFPAQ